MNKKKLIKLTINIFFIILFLSGNGCKKETNTDLEKKLYAIKDEIGLLIDKQNNEIFTLKTQIKELQDMTKESISFDIKLQDMESRVNELTGQKNKKAVAVISKSDKKTDKVSFDSTKKKFDTLNVEISNLKNNISLLTNKIKNFDTTEKGEKWDGFPFKFVNHNGYVQFDQDKEYFKVVGKLVNLSNKVVDQLVVKGKIYGQRDETLEEVSFVPDIAKDKMSPKRIIKFALIFSQQPANSDRYKVWVDKYKYER
ncbi:hypothetical protein HZA55_01050 [Candidatus Poribacteria bacterium]|nr:hypothetical protein [Candidatus Poribacteria bacterium]